MSQFSEVEWPLPFDLYHGVQSNFLGSPGLHFASWICLVTWKMQVAFCENMIPHSDSGPQPQSPASATFQERQGGGPGSALAAQSAGALPSSEPPPASGWRTGLRPLASS